MLRLTRRTRARAGSIVQRKKRDLTTGKKRNKKCAQNIVVALEEGRDKEIPSDAINYDRFTFVVTHLSEI